MTITTNILDLIPVTQTLFLDPEGHYFGIKFNQDDDGGDSGRLEQYCIELIRLRYLRYLGGNECMKYFTLSNLIPGPKNEH